jgi:hypothetical protein
LRFEMAPLRHLKEKRVRRKASHRLTHV